MGRIDGLATRIEEVMSHVDGLGLSTQKSFDCIEAKLDQLEVRAERIETKLDRHETRIKALEARP